MGRITTRHTALQNKRRFTKISIIEHSGSEAGHGKNKSNERKALWGVVRNIRSRY